MAETRLPHGAQPIHPLHYLTTLPIPYLATILLEEGQTKSPTLSALDQSRHSRHVYRWDFHYGAEKIPHPPARSLHDIFQHRSLAVLCSAPVRGHLLGTQRKMGLRRCRSPRKLLLQITKSASMVLRQHRLPSHPSSQCPYPKLPFTRMSRSRRNVPRRASHDTPIQPSLSQIPPLGRRKLQTSKLQIPQRTPSKKQAN